MTSEKADDWRLGVFESLSFPTLILKPDRTVIAANSRFLQQCPYPIEDIEGMTCQQLFTICDGTSLPCDDEECPMDATLATGKPQSFLRKISNGDENEVWQERVFSPILGDDGEVQYVIESLRDVTRTKNLERMVSGVRQFIDRVFQSSASSIVAADRLGRIMLMNSAAEELFGYTYKETQKIRIQDLYPPGGAMEVMKAIRNEELGGKGKLPVTPITIINKAGEEIPVEMTAAIIYEDTTEAATMGIYNDLRERLDVEEQLRDAQAQVLQSEKLASMGRLAAGVAHELNNPLTSIVMEGNLALEELEDDEEMRQHIAYILEDANRCAGIVKNLLAYSRQTSANKSAFQFADMVRKSLGLIRDQRMFMNIEVHKEISDEHMPVFGDRNQLAQVVINLVINAVDAMQEEGKLSFHVYKDEVKNSACLTVSDTGCGIPDDHVFKVFDPFFTTKEPGKGTGLGLSTVYGIVRDNNGAVSIKETGPEGTTFLVELPLTSDEDGDLIEMIS